MDVKRSLVKLTFFGGCCVLGSVVFPPMLTQAGLAWGAELVKTLASVVAGNTANALDTLTAGEDPFTLENADLTKAVGKAIAAVITLAAKEHRDKKTHDNLEKIAAQAKNNWVKIAQQELTQQRYPQLREAKLDQFLTPEEYSLTQDGNLSPQEWQDIFISLNMAACKGGGFQLPPEVYPQVAELLHTTFPKALRQTLKEDFKKDGKAFAGLTLQLLTGMKAELAQLRNTNMGVNTAELTQILQEFQQLETQLRGTVAQQQAFFRQISQDIDSGFADVCQRMGVMETTIGGLLQNLEESLELLRQDVAEVRQEMHQGFEELRTQQGGRQLSRQEFQTRKNLLNSMRAYVEQRLAQSLHYALNPADLLNLGKEQQPYQVQRPWDVSVKVGEERSFQLPSQTSILEVFENPAMSGKFLILGKPGGGKTTTLLELAQALVERAETDSDAPIPVILELSEWRTVTKRKFPDFWNQEKYDPSIKEWILSQLQSKGVSQEIGEQWSREKELVLLLDGLDELPSERQAKCVRAINEFLDSEFSPLHLVVCSRKEEYENYEEVLHLNGAICLEDLSVEQIQHYFASVNLGEFWESIKDSEKIVNFISQPLFLAITSIAYQQIDVEEWRNCNTEKSSIDYILGVYRIKMLSDRKESKWHTRKPYLVRKCQNSLVRLARHTNKARNYILVNELQNNTLLKRENIVQKFLTYIFSFVIFFAILYFAPRDYQNKISMIDDNIIGVPLGFTLYLIGGMFVVSTVPSPILLILLCKQFIVFVASLLKEVNNLVKYFVIVIGSIFSIAITLIIQAMWLLMGFLGWEMYKLAGSKNPLFLSVAWSPIIKATILSFLITFSLYLLQKDCTGSLNSIIGINQSHTLKSNKLGLFWSWTLLFWFWTIFAIIFIFIWNLFVQTSNNIPVSINFFIWFTSLGISISIILGFMELFRFLMMKNVAIKETVNFYLFLFLISTIFFALGMLLGFILSLDFGIIAALGNGTIIGLIFTSWVWFICIDYFTLRLTLWLTGQMPWNITRFLDYCTKRLILQRVGNRYRFIHRLVQEHFANLEIQKE